jgi:hypothetical protein
MEGVGSGLAIPQTLTGDSFLSTLLLQYRGSIPTLGSVRITASFMEGGMPGGFRAFGQGAFRTVNEQAIQVAGVDVHLYAPKSDFAQATHFQAFALKDRDLLWLFDQAFEAIPFGDGATRMGEALYDQCVGSQGANVAGVAKREFLRALFPDFHRLSAEDPRVADFTSRVARMGTRTGLMTFDDREEGLQLARRALKLLQEIHTRAGSPVVESEAENDPATGLGLDPDRDRGIMGLGGS